MFVSARDRECLHTLMCVYVFMFVLMWKREGECVLCSEGNIRKRRHSKKIKVWSTEGETVQSVKTYIITTLLTSLTLPLQRQD